MAFSGDFEWNQTFRVLNSIFDLSTCEVEKYKPSNRVPFWQEDDPETFVDNEDFQ